MQFERTAYATNYNIPNYTRSVIVDQLPDGTLQTSSKYFASNRPLGFENTSWLARKNCRNETRGELLRYGTTRNASCCQRDPVITSDYLGFHNMLDGKCRPRRCKECKTGGCDLSDKYRQTRRFATTHCKLNNHSSVKMWCV